MDSRLGLTLCRYPQSVRGATCRFSGISLGMLKAPDCSIPLCKEKSHMQLVRSFVLNLQGRESWQSLEPALRIHCIYDAAQTVHL